MCRTTWEWNCKVGRAIRVLCTEVETYTAWLRNNSFTRSIRDNLAVLSKSSTSYKVPDVLWWLPQVGSYFGSLCVTRAWRRPGMGQVYSSRTRLNSLNSCPEDTSSMLGFGLNAGIDSGCCKSSDKGFRVRLGKNGASWLHLSWIMKIVTNIKPSHGVIP